MYSFYASAYSILRHRILSSLSNLLRTNNNPRNHGFARLCQRPQEHRLRSSTTLHGRILPRGERGSAQGTATATQHVEQLKTSNTGLKQQRDYNAAMLNNANVRIDNMERFQDITQRAMLYQSEVIQCLTTAFKNVTTGEPQHSIFTAQVQFELDTIHNTFSTGHPWMERTIVDDDIEMENDEPLVPIQDDEETETDMEDGEETDSDMEIEI